MKVGQLINYVDKDGTRHSGVVMEIVGTDKKSLKKRLDIDYDLSGTVTTAKDVPHETDAPKDSHFYLLKGERRSRDPEDEPSEEENEVADAIRDPAFPDRRDEVAETLPVDEGPPRVTRRKSA